jgi:inner membrane protein
MENWLPWAWIVLAVIFAIGEIFTSGFFLICFGVGAAIAAITGFVGFGPLTQFAIFVASSAMVLFSVRPFVSRVSGPNRHAVGVERLLGQQAIVLETIDPARGYGVVRVGHEKWSADAADGVPIAAGTMVQVVGATGTHLKVRTPV